MAKYRKKPVVIEAFQMTQAQASNTSEWPDWLKSAYQKDRGVEGSLFPVDQGGEASSLFIQTLEGLLTVSLNDWIIQGVHGEIYPCKPDIFDKTYEAI